MPDAAAIVVLSRNFTLAELTFSQTAARKNIANKPSARQVEALRALCINILQPVRDALGQPLTVSSGYRSPALNAAVRGAKKSQHIDGQAADIVCFAIPTKDLFKRILQLGLPFDQIIYEGGKTSIWVHVSFKADGDNRAEILAASFPKSGGVKYRKLTFAQAMEI